MKRKEDQKNCKIRFYKVVRKKLSVNKGLNQDELAGITG